MSSLVDRLREVVGARDPGPGTRDPGSESVESRVPSPGSRIPNTGSDAADVLGGDWRESRGQRFLVVDRKYLPGYRHGCMTVADHLPPAEGSWPSLSLLAGVRCSGRMLFIDLETTGIAGGAGTYAFVIGCGWFESGAFRTRQFFLASFAAERVLLEAVAEAADACGTIVSYNGKSFDLPLMETRFVLHRMEAPFAGMPHVDMLHPARQLWRDDCRLSALEETLCGHIRAWDVPGFEIPARYFNYVRTADARRVEAVMEHNRLDLLSLALITARASQLLIDGAAVAGTGREAVGLGRLYERAGLNAEAGAAFRRAADMPDVDAMTRAEALREYAVLSRRERRYEEAAAAWRRILEIRHCPSQILRDAVDGLAVHHEHRLCDPMAARRFALQSMKLSQTVARQQALQHRLARLNRKIGVARRAPASLF